MVTPMSDTKPTVTIPDTEPPAELVIDDLVVGDGAEATKGANVIVHYVGVAWSNGQQFDSSWDRNDPFEFRAYHFRNRSERAEFEKHRKLFCEKAGIISFSAT